MSLETFFVISQLALLTQAFLLHPHYGSNANIRLIRLAFIPLSLTLLAAFGSQWRAQARVSSLTNVILGAALVFSCLRSLIWGTAAKPYHSLSDPNPSDSSVLDRLRFAIELISSPRGIGWSFGIPSKPLNQTRKEFLVLTLRRLSFNLAIFASSILCLGVIDNSGFATSLFSRHLTSFFAGTFAWTMLDASGCFFRLFVFCFNLDLSHNPFFLDSPIQATSLADFWSRRWHSLLRQIFVEIGACPATAVARPLIGDGSLNKSIGILGAFAVSGFMHEFGLWYATSFDPRLRTTLFFTAQGLGVVLESSFKRLTGLRVGGWAGRVWMFAWLVGWGRLMIDAWIEKGVGHEGREQMRSYFTQPGFLMP